MQEKSSLKKKELLHKLTLVSRYLREEENIREEIERYRSVIEQIYEIFSESGMDIEKLINRFGLEEFIEF